MKLWQRYVIFIVAIFILALIYLLRFNWNTSNSVQEQADRLHSYYNVEEIRFLQDEKRWKQQEV
jgi:hypothetical protein